MPDQRMIREVPSHPAVLTVALVSLSSLSAPMFDRHASVHDVAPTPVRPALKHFRRAPAPVRLTLKPFRPAPTVVRPTRKPSRPTLKPSRPAPKPGRTGSERSSTAIERCLTCSEPPLTCSEAFSTCIERCSTGSETSLTGRKMPPTGAERPATGSEMVPTGPETSATGMWSAAGRKQRSGARYSRTEPGPGTESKEGRTGSAYGPALRSRSITAASCAVPAGPAALISGAGISTAWCGSRIR